MKNHGDDPTMPCGGCRKRHARPAADAVARRCGGPGRRAVASIAIMALAAVAMPPGSVPAFAAASSLPTEARRSLARAAGGKTIAGMHHPDPKARYNMERALEEAHDDHDHDDHDHEEEEEDKLVIDTTVAELAAAEGAAGDALFDDGNDDHDHGLEGSEGEDAHDSDDDHGHGSHGSHGSHDHGSHDSHDEFETMSSENSSSLPWGQVIGATLLVNLATLSGVLIVVMAAMHRGYLKMQGQDASESKVGHGLFFDLCIPAFAVGALIATAVFLVFPEALHLIEGGHADHSDHSDHAVEGDAHDDHDDHSGHGHRHLQEDGHVGHSDESVNAAKFGCAILGGFLLPLVFSIFFGHEKNNEAESASALPEEEDLCTSCREGDDTGICMAETVPAEGLNDTWKESTIVRKVEEGTPVEEGLTPQDRDPNEPEHAVGLAKQESLRVQVEQKPINRQLCASILLGDAFHNFADGVFIGAAFKSCSVSVAMSIILVTLFHEIAQELADFILLTRYAGLSVIKACVLNFLSGLSVCLGGIIFLAADPSDEATGVILAMAGGVYFNIAACETIPRLEGIVKGRMDRVWTLVSVIVGTVPIGLILLNHQHCG